VIIITSFARQSTTNARGSETGFEKGHEMDIGSTDTVNNANPPPRNPDTVSCKEVEKFKEAVDRSTTSNNGSQPSQGSSNWNPIILATRPPINLGNPTGKQGAPSQAGAAPAAAEKAASGQSEGGEYEGCTIAAKLATAAFTGVEPGTYTMFSAMLGPEFVPLGASADWLSETLHSSPAAEELFKKGLEGFCNDLVDQASKPPPASSYPELRAAPQHPR
jgi:hypothetical protein